MNHNFQQSSKEEKYLEGQQQALPLHYGEDNVVIVPEPIGCGHLCKWIGQGWDLFKQHWLAYMIFTVIVLIVPYLSYILPFVVDNPVAVGWIFNILQLLIFPLTYGFFIVGMNDLRANERSLREQLHLSDFLGAYWLFLPLVVIIILLTVFIILGLILLIIPGIYLIVTLGWAPYLYIEYHRQLTTYNSATTGSLTLNIWTSITYSRRIIHKHFWVMLVFGWFQVFLIVSSAFTLVGILVVFPVVMLANVAAFKDLFGMKMDRYRDNTCYFC